MKKVLLSILLMVSIVSYGKNEIILQKGIRIYCINNPTINLQIKQYVTYGAITETVNKNKKWYIVKFINVGEKLEKYYNAIIISKTQNIKNKVYAVMYDDLGNYKYLIDNANNKIKEMYDVTDNDISLLNDSLDIIKKQYINDTLSNNNQYRNKSSEYINECKKIKKELTDSLSLIFQKEKERLYNELSQKLKNFTKILNITYSKLYYPNSAGGCDVSFNYINTSNKTIKYLYFNNIFYNSVNDKIPCEIRGFNFQSCEDVGFIDPGDTGGGTWENVIYNYSARHFIIKSIRIVYTNGTVYTISLTKDEYIKLIDYFDFINSIDSNIGNLIKGSDIDNHLNDNLEKLKSINEDNNKDVYKRYNNYTKRINQKILELECNKNIFYEFNIKESILYFKKPTYNKFKNTFSLDELIYEIDRLNYELQK